MQHWWNDNRQVETNVLGGRPVPVCQLVHQKSHMDCNEIEPHTPWWQNGD